MRVGQRLVLAVVPAVLGVLAMAALAYWGQRGRQVPDRLVLAGLAAAVLSLGMTWRNTRYLARRIDALSRRHGTVEGEGADELDSMERAIVEAARRGETREQAAEALVREYAGLLEETSAAVGRRLDEVRLPLHVLLATPFGALNENQEEMISAAQAAADVAGEELRSVARIVDLDAGRVESRPQAIRPRDLLTPVLAAAASRIRQAGGALESDLPTLLPHVHVDPRHSREALSLVLDRLAGRAGRGSGVRLAADIGEGFVRLRVEDGSLRADERFPLAQRLLRLQGAGIAASLDGALEIRLPTAGRAPGAPGHSAATDLPE